MPAQFIAGTQGEVFASELQNCLLYQGQQLCCESVGPIGLMSQPMHSAVLGMVGGPVAGHSVSTETQYSGAMFSLSSRRARELFFCNPYTF